jgi:hypothetical protein
VVNRSQLTVLAFLAAAWIAFCGILLFAPHLYVGPLSVPPAIEGFTEIALLAGVTALIAGLAVAVLRRWRWGFWLIVVAFLAGVFRAPASLLELTGKLPVSGPSWYVVVQGLVGVVQFVIGIALLVGYRKSGVWGAF